MANELTESTIMKTLDWVYDKAVNGVGIAGIETAEDMANDYLKGNGDLVDKVNSLIRWQNTKAATSGFLTGLGGILLMPVTIPANLASVMYVQIQMIATIAVMGGYDPREDAVKTLVYACLTGNALKDILKDTGIVIGTKLATSAIKCISGKTLTMINQRVGFRLLTKFGEKGAINLGKAIPFVGGVIGGTIDFVATNTIGTIARNTFIGEPPEIGQSKPHGSSRRPCLCRQRPLGVRR